MRSHGEDSRRPLPVQSRRLRRQSALASAATSFWLRSRIALIISSFLIRERSRTLLFISSRRALRSRFSLRKEPHHLAIERRNIRRLTAGYPIPVAYHFFIFPLATGIANIVLNCVVAGKDAAFHQACGNQQPRPVADDGNRFARAIEAAHKFLRFWLNPQMVGIQSASRQQHSVIVVRIRLI